MTEKYIVPTLLVLLLLLAGCHSAPPEVSPISEPPDQQQSETDDPFCELIQKVDEDSLEDMEDTSVRREIELPDLPHALLQLDDTLKLQLGRRWYMLYRQIDELVAVSPGYTPPENSSFSGSNSLCLRNGNDLLFMNSIYIYVELDGDGIVHPIDFFPENPVVEGSEEAKIMEITYDERYFYQTPGTIYLFYGTSYGGGHSMYSCFYGVDLETLEAFRFQYVEGRLLDMQQIGDRFYMLLGSFDLNWYSVYEVSVEDLSILEHHHGVIGSSDNDLSLNVREMMFGENGEIYIRYQYSGLGPMLVHRVV